MLLGGEETLVYAGEEGLYPLASSLAELLAAGRGPLEAAVDAALARDPVAAEDIEHLRPIDTQEVWASGVTYMRSRAARMSESVAADVYSRVYEAPRPELFLKSPAWRVPAPGSPLRIRRDSNWDVPEPELGLVVSADAEIVGFLVGDDMSSREIEGDNPLYLPQAKIYDDALGLSETIVLARERTWEATDISVTITRAGATVYTGTISTSAMRRSFEELVGYLFRELTHPSGAVLLTGTGLVPPDEVTLQPGDDVAIAIDRVGSLRHGVYRAD
ncbi:MAG TPA: fumarylacetoacetate hydrolase family protein [Solirubrobacteraceae bacterium]